MLVMKVVVVHLKCSKSPPQHTSEIDPPISCVHMCRIPATCTCSSIWYFLRPLKTLEDGLAPSCPQWAYRYVSLCVRL